VRLDDQGHAYVSLTYKYAPASTVLLCNTSTCALGATWRVFLLLDANFILPLSLHSKLASGPSFHMLQGIRDGWDYLSARHAMILPTFEDVHHVSTSPQAASQCTPNLAGTGMASSYFMYQGKDVLIIIPALQVML
jgi:hypothetical protein